MNYMSDPYNFASQRAVRNDISQEIGALIDAGLQRERSLEERRAYNVSPSLLGGPCDRQTQYSVTHAPSSGFDGRTLRIFDRGNEFERVMIKYLELAGFIVSGTGPDGRQHGFSIANGEVRGRLDGILLDGPAIPDLIYPCVVEIKTLGMKSMNELRKKGLREGKRQYAIQVAQYQAYTDFGNPALFCALSPDDMGTYFEVVPFDGELAQEASDLAFRTLSANRIGELLPRASDDPSRFPCSWKDGQCQFFEHCWSTPEGGGLGPVRGSRTRGQR